VDVIKKMNVQDRFMYATIGAGIVVIALQIWSIIP
jgi:hypothetical protein